MSICLGYYFDSEQAFPDVARTLGRVLGCSFAPYRDNHAHTFCRFLSLELSLCTHTLEDDRDCDFSNYPYQLETRTPVPDADLRDCQLTLMSLIPSLLHRRANVSDGILVYDVQRLLARYAVLDNQLFDSVTQQIVAFPGHTNHVVSSCLTLLRTPP